MDDITGPSGMNNVTQLPNRSRYSAFRDGGDDQPDLLDNQAPIWIETDAWDEADIKRRPWVVPGYLMRGAVTVTSGPGSAGKSMLAVAQTIAIALGRKLGTFHPRAPGKAFLYNVEDDDDEQRRRYSAALRSIGHAPADLTDRVFRLGPSNVGTLIRVDPMSKRLTFTSACHMIEALIERHRPDVVYFDPFVELHDTDENDNTGVRSIMAWFRSLARRYELAVHLAHHSRKGIGSQAGDPDSLRGASSIVGAARVVLTVNSMDAKEADKLNIPQARRRDYFRLDGAKSNYAPPEEVEWFQRQVHELENGDTAVAALPWTPPTPLKSIPVDLLNQALDRIQQGPSAGVLYTAKRNGGGDRWAGIPLMDICDMGEAQAKDLIGKWVTNQLLVDVEFKHPEARRKMVGVRVDFSKRPTE